VRKGQQSRRDIVRKAAPIFNQRGFAGASLSDLMLATGREKGGIYRHFKSKEQLASEAFRYAWSVALEARFAGTHVIPNAVDRLKQVVRNFRDRREGLVPGGCPLLNTAIESDDGNPVLRGQASRALTGCLQRFSEIVEEGKRNAEIRSDVCPNGLATLILGTLEGALMIARLQRNREPLNIACTHLERYLECDIRAAKSDAPRNKIVGLLKQRNRRQLEPSAAQT
jgi:TetR/AcrR family transcriptional regulator, transcriptional repressor for nem operon